MLIKRLSFFALFIFVVLFFPGCGGSSKSSSGSKQNLPLTINSVTLPTGYVGSSYTSTTLTATGGSGTGYTWAASSGSALPAGITLSAAGVITGKPTADGISNFGVTVTDSANATASAQLSMTVNKGVSITTAAALPDGYVGAAYSQTLAATGGTGTGYAWIVDGGSNLPTGLTLTSAGILSGKPTAPGAATFSITVTDSARNSATVQFSAAIKTGIAVATLPTLPNAFVGQYYAEQLEATGGSGTGYTWSLAAAATIRSHARRMTSAGLPDGLTLSSDGWIKGTPTQTGTSTATVIVTDSAGNSASMDITIVTGNSLVISTAPALPGGHPGDSYSLKFTASGGSGTGFAWTSPNLPGGLRLAADGTLNGSLPAVNTYSFNVTVADSEQNNATGTFTIRVTNELRLTTRSDLPQGYVGLAYGTSLSAKGGSGAGYLFKTTAGSALPAGIWLTTGGALTGTPTAAGSFGFNVTVTDSGSNSAQQQFTLTVGDALAITSPYALPAATVGTAYSQALATSGGAGTGLIWTLTSGASSLSTVGLSFSNGVVSGTPATTGVATFSVAATDASMTRSAKTFTIAVNTTGSGFTVSGQIMLGNVCGNTPIPAITLSLNSSPAKAVTSDSNGMYSFASVPDGSYTITPSIAGASAIFTPATLPVTVSGGAVSNQNFAASLAYKVSGTVSYAGPQSGQVYIWLLNKNCGGNPLGTSISAPGTFTIEGVPPGSYQLGAGIDSLGFGYQNDVDPRSTAADVKVDDADVTGTTIDMTNPTQSALTTGPTINAITANDNGVVIHFMPILGPLEVFNGVELATSYEIQWADQSPFPAQPTGSKIFAAGGSNGTGLLILSDPNLVPGNVYYFRMRGVNQAGNGPWTDVSKLLVAAPAGNTVSGTVTFDAQPTGPLYVGYHDVSSGKVYSTRIQSPVSPQSFSLKVPTGQTYFQFAILDQNNDGMIDPGDISNTRNNDANPAPVTGDMTGQELLLNSSASKATVTTSHTKTTHEDGTQVETFALNFQVKEGDKLPVSVRLVSGPHILHPVDLGKCPDCGNNQFRFNVTTTQELPAADDSFDLLVTYSDGTSETLTAQVTGVLNAFATGLAPSGASDTSLTPTFTWTDPANAGNYQYQFYLTDNQGNTIWQIPGNNSNSGGFTSQVSSITWGTDPTSASNPPSVNALTHGVTYTWHIQIIDANGNTTGQRTWYKP